MRAVILGAAVALIGAAPDRGPEARRSAAGVTAVEAHWSRAFVGGDEQYLSALLDESYVSVGPTGEPHGKAVVIEHARRYAASHPAPPVVHPPARVEVRGNTALVRFRSDQDISVDLFEYRNGRWHAWYSQHTKPA